MRTYSMCRRSMSIVRLRKFGVCAGAAGLGMIAMAAPTRAALLLSDNYTVPSNQNDPNQALAGRQAGSLATLTYSTNGGNVQTGNTTTMRSGGDGNYLLLAFNGRASLDQDLNGPLSQGGLNISFDVSPELTVGSSDWSSVDLGEANANRFLGVNQNFAHFGIIFRANGLFQAFDGNTAVGAGPFIDPSVTPPGGQDSFATITLAMSDSTDGNPFDGAGQTTINAYSPLFSGGLVPFYSFTKTGGGYTDNYLTLSSTHIGGFDNLAISSVPEPMGLGTCVIGGIAVLGCRRRAQVK